MQHYCALSGESTPRSLGIRFTVRNHVALARLAPSSPSLYPPPGSASCQRVPELPPAASVSHAGSHCVVVVASLRRAHTHTHKSPHTHDGALTPRRRPHPTLEPHAASVCARAATASCRASLHRAHTHTRTKIASTHSRWCADPTPSSSPHPPPPQPARRMKSLLISIRNSWISGFLGDRLC